DAVAKSLVRFVGAKTRCYQTCATNMRRGSIAPGSCDPPLPADPATSACIAAAGFGSPGAGFALGKVSQRIFDPPKNTRPACYTMVTGTGEGWVPAVESYVDSRISISACGG